MAFPEQMYESAIPGECFSDFPEIGFDQLGSVFGESFVFPFDDTVYNDYMTWNKWSPGFKLSHWKVRGKEGRRIYEKSGREDVLRMLVKD